MSENIATTTAYGGAICPKCKFIMHGREYTPNLDITCENCGHVYQSKEVSRGFYVCGSAEQLAKLTYETPRIFRRIREMVMG